MSSARSFDVKFLVAMANLVNSETSILIHRVQIHLEDCFTFEASYRMLCASDRCMPRVGVRYYRRSLPSSIFRAA